ncbi:MAG: hypothetical protein AAFV95_09560 [Bacteroidota bacterium]
MNHYLLKKVLPNNNNINDDIDILYPYHFDLPKSLRKYRVGIDKGDVFLPPGIKLRAGKKFDDLMSFINIRPPYLVISPTFFDFLQDFRLPELHVQDLKVVKRTKYQMYRFVFSRTVEHDAIVYPQSHFHIEDCSKTPATFTDVSFESAQEMIQREEGLGGFKVIGSNKVVIDFSRVPYDFFRLPWISRVMGYVVSENLKNAIEKSNLTGIRFHSLENYNRLVFL